MKITSLVESQLLLMFQQVGAVGGVAPVVPALDALHVTIEALAQLNRLAVISMLREAADDLEAERLPRPGAKWAAGGTAIIESFFSQNAATDQEAQAVH